MNAYVAALAVTGVGVLAAAGFAVTSTPSPVRWLAFAALVLVLGSFRLTFAGVAANIAIDDALLLAMAMLFGPGPVTLTIAASGLMQSWRRGQSPQKILFNTTSLAIAMWGASHVFFALAHVKPLAEDMRAVGTVVLPVLGMASAYFALNAGLTACAVALETGQPLFRVWRHFRWLSVSYVAAASVAFCLVLLIQQASFLALLLVIPIFAIFHLTLRASFGRAEDARRHVAEVDRLYHSTVETLAMAIDAKDDVTHSHVRRVQAYAMALAKAVGVTDEPTLKAIDAAALLHDTGKLAVPEHILNKPGKLTSAEFEKMKLHADIGADILSLVHFPYPVEPIVRCHHENWDGTGYPRGLSGDAIPIGARILSVVDCFDALTSDRPYRGKLSNDAAIAILRDRSGVMYDPAIVETFVAIFQSVPIDIETTAEQREVLRRISATKRDGDVPAVAQTSPFGVTHDLLTFVSLARLSSGDASVLDVLSIASNLVSDILPGVTGAWYLAQESKDRLVVADAFGPASSALTGYSISIGERLTGWVASTGQPIVDSDAALDLGLRTDAVTSALRRCMSVPLAVGTSVVGVLTLYATESDVFTGERARLVQVIAPHLAIAINAALTAEHGKPVLDRQDRNLRLVSAR
ncbi:MAG TPA: HD domain-containing phosphohydrolase [Vicinamibacterales bacterium]|nr:HD domain-containing phosphohydrolase [Vicinamibacterales bacterium]